MITEAERADIESLVGNQKTCSDVTCDVCAEGNRLTGNALAKLLREYDEMSAALARSAAKTAKADSDLRRWYPALRGW